MTSKEARRFLEREKKKYYDARIVDIDTMDEIEIREDGTILHKGADRYSSWQGGLSYGVS